MTPTPKLRFVERGIAVSNDNGFGVTTKTVRILQQWWQGSNMGSINLGWTGDIAIGEVKGEWRDVPVEKES